MASRRVRLGDQVDDYCPRCRLVMNHGIVALDGEKILKVQCNTCMNPHPYRHGKAPKKKDPVKSAYDELMSRLPGGGAPARGREPVDSREPRDPGKSPEEED